MSNVNATPGSNDRRLRVPRLFMAIFAVLVLVAIGYFLVRETPPPPTASEAPKDLAARFESIQGNVKTRGVGGLEWKTAFVNVPLRRSDLVRTYPSSSAEIKFFDETRVTVRPDSLITIEETSRDPGSVSGRVAWKVTSGEINYETSRRSAGSTEAVTPTFRLALEGNSAGTMRVGDNGQAAVAQLTGSASLRTKTGEAIRLGANEGIKIDAAGKAGAKQALPSIPVPEKPGGGTLLLAEGDPVSLSWAAAAGAVAYRVQVEAVAVGGRETVFDKDGIKGTTATPSGVTKGAFAFRVAALTADGISGRFSDAVTFTVERSAPVATRPTIADTPPPLLVIRVFEARSNVIRLAGKTEPGARLTVNGDPVTVQPDGSFSEFITLARKQGEQRVVIRATSPAGGVAEETRTVTAGQ